MAVAPITCCAGCCSCSAAAAVLLLQLYCCCSCTAAVLSCCCTGAAAASAAAAAVCSGSRATWSLDPQQPDCCNCSSCQLRHPMHSHCCCCCCVMLSVQKLYLLAGMPAQCKQAQHINLSFAFFPVKSAQLCNAVVDIVSMLHIQQPSTSSHEAWNITG